MKPEPARQLVTNNAGSVGHITATMMPLNSMAAPTSMGLRTPMRSIRRPSGTEKVIGSNASNDNITPTVNGEASRFSAKSDSVTRVPVYARCSAMLNGSMKASVTGGPGSAG